MKTRILILVTTIAVVMFGAVTAIAQGKSIYFMKDGDAVYSSTIANIDSVILAPTPRLYVNPSTLSFSAAATESKDVVVNTNQSLWSVSSDQTWCTVTKGTNKFTVTATANTVAEQRTATITVSAGYAPDVIVAVTQASWVPTDEIEITGSLAGGAVQSVQSGNSLYIVYILRVGNYSGELPLCITANNNTWGRSVYDRTINVDANTNYTIQVRCSLDDRSYTSNTYPYTVTVSSNDVILKEHTITLVSATISGIYIQTIQ